MDALWPEHSWVLSTRRQLLSPALRSVLQQKAWKVLVCPEGKVLRVSLVPAMQPLMVQLATAHFCSVPGGRHSSKCSQHGLNKHTPHQRVVPSSTLCINIVGTARPITTMQVTQLWTGEQVSHADHICSLSTSQPTATTADRNRLHHDQQQRTQPWRAHSFCCAGCQ